MTNPEQQLHYHYQKLSDNAPTMIFLHGLFGDLNNLGVITRAFHENYSILQIDLRNHGQSFHSNEMTYALMAQDIKQLLEQLEICNAIVIGHSMGGKTAMALTALAPKLVSKLVVIDIAPVPYHLNRHDDIFKGLFAVKNAKPENRQQAKIEIAKGIHDPGVQQFMLKSFDPQRPEYFKFNLSGLYHNYHHIMDWKKVYVETPTLFIKGELSDYLQEKDTKIVLDQFPNAKLFIVSNAYHLVHTEKPDAVIRAIQKFLG
ncbi:acyl-CoA esterase [Vespertiliibacter pulmonis]|nr:alpha/beta fold hydrolase [Vespertiliibacter pulmonis]QLB21605.1 acyl-CoA esterase [Vespertiliibacter pulmonis]